MDAIARPSKTIRARPYGVMPYRRFAADVSGDARYSRNRRAASGLDALAHVAPQKTVID